MIYRGQLEKNIYLILEPTLHSMGYDIIRIRIHGTQKSKTMQIMIERLDGQNITIDDCSLVNYQVVPSLVAKDINIADFNVEISSPGIDRPLTRDKDFADFLNHMIKIKTFRQIHGITLFVGVLTAFDATNRRIELSLKNPIKKTTDLIITKVEVELDNIHEAKLVIDHNKLFNKQPKKKLKPQKKLK